MSNPYAPKEGPDPNAEYIERNGIRRIIKNLNRAVCGLQNALIDFSQLEPYEAAGAFNMARGELEKTTLSAQAVRAKITALLKAVGASHFVAKARPLEFDLERGPRENLMVVRRLASGLTGCRNAIQELLEHDPSLLAKELSRTGYEIFQLQRLASLHKVLKNISFADPKNLKGVIQMQQTTAKLPIQKPIRKKTKHRRSVPINPEALDRLSKEWDKLADGQIYPTAHEVGKEIILHQEDLLAGHDEKEMDFGRLREIFEYKLTSKQLKRALELLKLEFKKYGIRLIGSFELQGDLPLTLEMNRQESSAQPTK